MSRDRLLGPALAGAVVVSAVIAQPASPGPAAAAKQAAQSPKGTHVMLTSDDLKWGDAPPGLPKGARVAVIEGDPAKPGPFTMRAEMPPNYRIMPHWHPAIEHVTVLSGELYMGNGEKLDEAGAKRLPPGGFSVMPIGHVHFAFTNAQPAVLQLHGIGPWGITYVNPADDPRRGAPSK